MLPKIFFIILVIIPSSFNVGFAGVAHRNFAGDSPFTAKAALIRYWKTHISGNNPPSSFFLNKASPLTAVQLVKYSNLAGKRSLSAQLAAFCKEADLLCFPEVGPSLKTQTKDANFAVYKFDNFTNYGTDRRGGADSFHAYSNDVVQSDQPENPIAVDTFRQYSRGSTAHNDKFTTYANGSTLPNQVFNSYGKKSIAGAGEFSNYFNNTIVLNFPTEFTSYSDSAKGRTQDFKEYANNAVIGQQNFTSYGKNAEKATNEFSRYGDDSNGIDSTFDQYVENSAAATDNFASYADNNRITENHFNSYAGGAKGAAETFSTYTPTDAIPISEFRSYGSGGNAVHQEFINYSDESGSPHHLFKSYGADSKSEILGFVNYAASFDEENFVGYDKNITGQKVDFKTYRQGNHFKDYAKTGATFATYLNETAAAVAVFVEPGKFFREKMLRTGTVMPMPDIKDKMPKRSFLPRAIFSKLPFSSGEIEEMKSIFHAGEGSDLTGLLDNAVRECERAPSPGETKRCAGSGEDMIDFATSVLGKNVTVRITENTRGSGGDIVIGNVMGINGGKVTKSVSCHQSLYPSLLYYCHSVPKVRVYEADILDPNFKEKINRGVAICHVDTSSWSSGHGAFSALGSGPGKIEVCHWIFENDMTWTISD